MSGRRHGYRARDARALHQSVFTEVRNGAVSPAPVRVTRSRIERVRARVRRVRRRRDAGPDAGKGGPELRRTRHRRPRPWPCLLTVIGELRAVAEQAWQDSPTFRDQCRKLAAAGARVIVQPASSREMWRAQTRIHRTDDGATIAYARVRPSADSVELIAHELEHVIEYLEGIRFLMEAHRGTSRVKLSGGAYETQRAIDTGRRVAQEVRDATTGRRDTVASQWTSTRSSRASSASSRALIGVIHVGGLPGTPSHDRSLPEIVEAAVAEARLYMSAGFHGVVIENTHDRPYLKGAVGPEIVASLAVIGQEIRRAVPAAPLGVQILAGANQAALAVALACGASFVRVEGFVFAHVADEGLIESSAAALLRYRRTIGAEGIRVFADIKKKHSAHAMTADVSLVETAKAAEFFLVDGVIVTGISTGQPTDAGEVRSVAAAIGVPVLVGSGVTSENLARLRCG